MMKIGASMLGQSVVCPDCERRIEVPFESDPRAEAMYQRMKQRKTNPTAPKSEQSAPSEQLPQQSSPTPQTQPDLSKPIRTTALSIPELSPDEAEQIDEWIDRLWTDVPDASVLSETRHYRVPFQDENGARKVVPVPPIDSPLKRTLGGDPVLRMLLIVVFLLGIGSGFTLRSLVGFSRNVADNSGSKGIAVQGKLTFETPDEKPMPDTDAVVIFLPIKSNVLFPINGRGLRPPDGAETSDEERFDAVQQIEELGGQYVRADTEGKFAFPLNASGRYLGILISSHAVRPPEVRWNAETEQSLRRFFREPSDLVGNYRFLCDEYELNAGETLSVQYNFSRL